MAIPSVLRLLVICNGDNWVAGDDLAGCCRVFQDANKAMKGDGKVGDSDRLYDCEHDYALDDVSRRILPMGLVGAYVKIGGISSPRPQRRSQP